jgi:hypothetical protein
MKTLEFHRSNRAKSASKAKKAKARRDAAIEKAASEAVSPRREGDMDEGQKETAFSQFDGAHALPADAAHFFAQIATETRTIDLRSRRYRNMALGRVYRAWEIFDRLTPQARKSVLNELIVSKPNEVIADGEALKPKRRINQADPVRLLLTSMLTYPGEKAGNDAQAISRDAKALKYAASLGIRANEFAEKIGERGQGVALWAKQHGISKHNRPTYSEEQTDKLLEAEDIASEQNKQRLAAFSDEDLEEINTKPPASNDVIAIKRKEIEPPIPKHNIEQPFTRVRPEAQANQDLAFLLANLMLI